MQPLGGSAEVQLLADANEVAEVPQIDRVLWIAHTDLSVLGFRGVADSALGEDWRPGQYLRLEQASPISVRNPVTWAQSRYRHFRSKDELVVATLELHEELWTRRWLEPAVKRRRKPRARLLAVFDALDDWFRQDDYEGCLFTNYLLEIRDPRAPIGAASIAKRANVRAFVRGLAEEAGVRDPDGFARQWQILMTGSIVAAIEGDVEAARRARAVGSLLLERELGR